KKPDRGLALCSLCLCGSKMNLRPATLQRIDEVIPHYPVKRSAALPLLHLVQEDVGYISQEAIEWIAQKLELQPINVYELVTFYPMFRPEPVGKYQIKVCRTLSCALGGSYKLHEHFCRFFFSSRRRHTRLQGDWSSDVCSSD